ncbi:MAG: hypothetical protein WCO04_15060 [Pseudomonadota bacterium]
MRWLAICVTAAVIWAVAVFAGHANNSLCGQGLVEQALGATMPNLKSLRYIEPGVPVSIVYQWGANNGYCGEASLISAGLANGQYMSQADARLACGAFFGKETNGSGASLLQSGIKGSKYLNSNAQMLLENVSSGVSGANDFAHASLCASNSGLKATTYPFATGFKTANVGLSGVQDYLSWVKAEMIAGHHVTIGVLQNGGDDAQYDHEVSVLKIGTNHAVNDPTYYADDVLYFDDHGLYTLQLNGKGQWVWAGNPAVPLGAGSDKTGCTPYVFGYPFGVLSKTRFGANVPGALAYSLVIPASTRIDVIAGNTSATGRGTVSINGPHNYALSVAGPLDVLGETKKIVLRIANARFGSNGDWVLAAKDSLAGFNYENPYISPKPNACDDGDCFTNIRPAPMKLTLTATVYGLDVGKSYAVYEFDLPAYDGTKTGKMAALPVPVSDFHRNADKAVSVTKFFARSTSYTLSPIDRLSNQIIVLRAVAD